MMRDRSNLVKAGPVATVGSDASNVLFDVWLASRSATGVLDAALAEAGLTADEFGIYSVLRGADGITPSDLARWMCAPPTTVSSYVKRFEGRGHLRRDPNPDDGRSSLLRLTRDGARAQARAATVFAPVLEAVQADLGSDEAAVRRALAALARALGSAAG